MRYLVREDSVYVLQETVKKMRKLLLFNDLVVIARKDWRDRMHLIHQAALKDIVVFNIKTKQGIKWFYMFDACSQKAITYFKLKCQQPCQYHFTLYS